MPMTLRIQQEPTRRRFVDTPSRAPAWQLIHREADRLYPELVALWATLFADTRQALDTDALEAALRRGSLLDAEALIRAAWDGEAAPVARRLLPELLRQTVARTAVALLPQFAQTLEVPLSAVQFNVVVPEALQAIDLYVGEQIVSIGERTLMAVRQVIRQGFQEGLSVTEQMARLERMVGLTPRQARALDALAQRLSDQGLSSGQVRQQVDAAARRALRLRAEAIARTESIDTASRAQQDLWRQAERQGLLDEAFKRFWLVTPDDRLCPVCMAIPGLNSQGVGLEEPFQTPVGPRLHPTVHVQCRCAVTLRRVA